MQVFDWYKKRSNGFKIGLLLASLHSFYLLYFFMPLGGDFSVSTFAWIAPAVIDMPFTLVLNKILYPIMPEMYLNFLPGDLGSLLNFILPFSFHFIIGGLWYFVLPIIIERLSNFLANNKSNTKIIVFLIVAPFSYWLIILNGVVFPNIGDLISDRVSFVIYLSICLLWTVCLSYLFFVDKNKRVAFLLLLIPFIYYYFYEYYNVYRGMLFQGN